MRKDNRLPSQPKGVYLVKNWPEYNAGLIQRGDVSIWMDEVELTRFHGHIELAH